MGRLMDFTTETPDCCEIGDILQVEENKLPTSYWYMIEHAYGASGNFKNRERLKTRSGKVVKKWNDERFKYLTLEFDEYAGLNNHTSRTYSAMQTKHLPMISAAVLYRTELLKDAYYRKSRGW